MESKELSVMDVKEASESQESVLRLRKRRVREKISELLPVQERIRTSREIAKQAMQAAMLLIQSHERARIGRCAGIDGKTFTNKLFFNNCFNTLIVFIKMSTS